jgi:hypothetical protein
LHREVRLHAIEFTERVEDDVVDREDVVAVVEAAIVRDEVRRLVEVPLIERLDVAAQHEHRVGARLHGRLRGLELLHFRFEIGDAFLERRVFGEHAGGGRHHDRERDELFHGMQVVVTVMVPSSLGVHVVVPMHEPPTPPSVKQPQ